VTTTVVSAQDGPRITVASMVKQPTLIPRRIIRDLEQEFIVNDLLRKLPPTQSGQYAYEESEPLFADGDAAIVEEFGEIPTIGGRVGQRKVAFTVKRALAMKVSQEMINRNNIDRVNKQIRQIRNTMVRTWETAFLQALLAHPDLNSVAAGTPWDDPGATIREDLVEATGEIENSAPADDTDNYFGFSPNTLVVGHAVRDALMLSDDFNKAYVDNKADESVLYTGRLPGRFFNVDAIMVSREMDRLADGGSTGILLERKTVGGIGDERPLRATPMYEDKPRETWRSDTVRQSAIVIDQPQAACLITNILT
jgi:hypothetical protein